MPKVILEMDAKEARELIEQLPLDDKIKLVKELEKETWAKRINNLFKAVDAQRKKHRLSSKAILKETANARKEFYARDN